MPVIRGDTAQWRIPVVDNDGQPFDLTGCTVTVTCKASVKDADADALFRHYLVIDGTGTVTASAGMTLESTAATGIVIERLDPAISATFAPGSYAYDVEVRAGMDVYTPILGEPLEVVADYGRTAPV